jgi:hypothetical protein
MAHIWEQEPKEAHANKRNKLSDFHYIVYTPFILFPPWGIALGGKSAFAVNDKYAMRYPVEAEVVVDYLRQKPSLAVLDEI